MEINQNSPTTHLINMDINELNNAVYGRTIKRILYDEESYCEIKLFFDDGGFITLSTLGGIEIQEIQGPTP